MRAATVTATATAVPEKNPTNPIFVTFLPIQVFRELEDLELEDLLFEGAGFFLAADSGLELLRFSAETRFSVFALVARREPWLDLSGIQAFLLRSHNCG